MHYAYCEIVTGAELNDTYIPQMLEALDGLAQSLAEYYSKQGVQPAVDSIASAEVRGFGEEAVTAHAQGGQLIVAAEDHLVAFIRVLAEPAAVMAPWTCVRAILESCALASWLLYPKIDAKVRIGRSFAMRHEGLQQQMALARLLDTDGVLVRVKTRTDEVERKALALGFAPVLDKKKSKRIGIGQAMPAITDLIRQELDDEIMYRMLSGVAHSHSYALVQVAFKRVEAEAMPYGDTADSEAKAYVFQKQSAPISMGALGVTAAISISRPAWYRSLLFGWNTQELAGILDRSFNVLKIRSERRCWKEDFASRTKGD